MSILKRERSETKQKRSENVGHFAKKKDQKELN
jgi:hypothetical protein